LRDPQRDGTLKFLALENVLVNSDGFGRASDYNIYLDPRVVFTSSRTTEAMMAAAGAWHGPRRYRPEE
jgi:hypothetical protein